MVVPRLDLRRRFTPIFADGVPSPGPPSARAGRTPRAGAMAIGGLEATAQAACLGLGRMTVVSADGRALVRREGVAALGENVDTASAVSTTVPTARLAKVVKESHYGDTVGREPARVGEHMVVHLNGVLREPAELFVMAVAAAAEEGRVVEVVDDGVRTGPSEGADGVEDPLLGVGDVLHILYLLRLKRANLSSDRPDFASPDTDSCFQRKIWKIKNESYFRQ